MDRNDWSVIRDAREANDRSVSLSEHPTGVAIWWTCVALAAIGTAGIVFALLSYCEVVPK